MSHVKKINTVDAKSYSEFQSHISASKEDPDRKTINELLQKVLFHFRYVQLIDNMEGNKMLSKISQSLTKTIKSLNEKNNNGVVAIIYNLLDNILSVYKEKGDIYESVWEGDDNKKKSRVHELNKRIKEVNQMIRICRWKYYLRSTKKLLKEIRKELKACRYNAKRSEYLG